MKNNYFNSGAYKNFDASIVCSLFYRSLLLLFFCSISTLQLVGQCDIKEADGRGFILGNCNASAHHSILGSVGVYGRCGDLVFSSPLTSNNVITSTKTFNLINISIYPNPFESLINIYLESPKPVSGVIRNSLGSIVKTFLINPSLSNRIDLAELPSGYYLLQTFQNNKSLSINKLIKI